MKVSDMLNARLKEVESATKVDDTMYKIVIELKVMERIVDRKGGTMLTSTPFIVTVNGMPIDPEIEGSTVKAGKVKFGMPHKVRRFSRENAELVAKCVTNSANEHKIEIKPWFEAIEDTIKTYRSLLEDIKK